MSKTQSWQLECLARECSRQTSLLRGSVALWGCSRQANWVFDKLWQPQLGELLFENFPLSVLWDFMVDYCNCHSMMNLILQLTLIIYLLSEMLNFKLYRHKISQNKTKNCQNPLVYSCTYHKMLKNFIYSFWAQFVRSLRRVRGV